MANLTITNSFTASTVASSSAVNQNFTDVKTWLNNRDNATDSWLNVKISGTLFLASGTAASPGFAWTAANSNGLFYVGSNTTGIASAGVLTTEFGPYGSSDDAQYNIVKGYSSSGTGYFKTGIYSTTGVTTSAKQIYGSGGTGDGGVGDGGLLLVYGKDSGSKEFVDLVLVLYHDTTPITVSSIANNSPATRTYSMGSAATYKLTMGSGTYSVRCIGIGMKAT